MHLLPEKNMSTIIVHIFKKQHFIEYFLSVYFIDFFLFPHIIFLKFPSNNARWDEIIEFVAFWSSLYHNYYTLKIKIKDHF